MDLTNIKKIKDRIIYLRDTAIIIDKHVAEIYCVELKRMNQQIKRNLSNFSDLHFFQVNEDEKQYLSNSFTDLVSLKKSRVLPNAFSIYGVLKIAFYLNNESAYFVSDYIIEAFVEILTQKNVTIDNSVLFDKILSYEKKFTDLEKRMAKQDMLIQILTEMHSSDINNEGKQIGFKIE